MYVCGTEEVVKATSDFDTNCESWSYPCNATLRVIVDVCSPDMRESKIYQDCSTSSLD
jgi:hypothetical protein